MSFKSECSHPVFDFIVSIPGFTKASFFTYFRIADTAFPTFLTMTGTRFYIGNRRRRKGFFTVSITSKVHCSE